MPKPVDVEQDIEPWKRALEALAGDRDTYSAQAEASRHAALQFVGGLRASQFEDMLHGLHPAGEPARVEQKPGSRIENLSPARRALLLQRLRERASK